MILIIIIIIKGGIFMICKKTECKLYLECLHDYNQYYRINIIKKLGPLLLKDKPIHLFCFKNDFKFKQEIVDLIEEHFSGLQNIQYVFIPCDNDTVKILFYNINNIGKVLKDHRKVNFLESRGFSREMGGLDYIQYLVKELQKNNIPPEIGIFFGYPVKDVIGYIGHPSLKRTEVKGWEYYGNPKVSNEVYETFTEAEQTVLKYLLIKQFQLEQFLQKLDLKIA